MRLSTFLLVLLVWSGSVTALSPSTTTTTHTGTLTRTFLTTTTKTTSTTKPPKALVTEAPAFDGDVDAKLNEVQEKWHLTTYYTCVTFGDGYVDCGLHEPVLPGGDEIAAADRRPRAKDAMTAAVAMGALAAGILFR